MLLSLYNDRPSSEAHFTAIHKDSLLERLKALDSRAKRKGLAALDPSRNRLIRIGTEIDDRDRVTKNGYGVFDLAWQAEHHPEWPGQISEELDQIRRRIEEAHGVTLRFLIWAGMGGSAEDKNMYNAVGLLKRGLRCYVLDSTDPAKLKNILADMAYRSKLPLPKILKRTLVVGMAMGMTSYEPVVNLEKLALLYAKSKVDSRPNFIYMTLPGSLLDRFASSQNYRRVQLQPDLRNSTAGRHSSPLTRGSLYPLGLCGRRFESVDGRDGARRRRDPKRVATVRISARAGAAWPRQSDAHPAARVGGGSALDQAGFRREPGQIRAASESRS